MSDKYKDVKFEPRVALLANATFEQRQEAAALAKKCGTEVILPNISQQKDEIMNHETNKAMSGKSDKKIITELRAENLRLENAMLLENLHRVAPCVICGYNGQGFHQPNKHKCVERLEKLGLSDGPSLLK